MAKEKLAGMGGRPGLQAEDEHRHVPGAESGESEAAAQKGGEVEVPTVQPESDQTSGSEELKLHEAVDPDTLGGDCAFVADP